MAFSSPLDRALVVSALVHARQRRKGTRVPYVMHPTHVAILLQRFGYGEPLTVAAVLHDVLEDMDFEDRELREDLAVSLPEARTARLDSRDGVAAFLRAAFGDEVVRLVLAVTEEKNEGRPEPPWIERKRQQLEHLAHAAPDEAVLKSADALHNVSSIVEDLALGRAGVGGRFKATPEESLWYYREIARLARERAGALPLLDALDAAIARLADAVARHG